MPNLTALSGSLLVLGAAFAAGCTRASDLSGPAVSPPPSAPKQVSRAETPSPVPPPSEVPDTRDAQQALRQPSAPPPAPPPAPAPAPAPPPPAPRAADGGADEDENASLPPPVPIIVYCSVARDAAEPVFKAFQDRTGVPVRAIYSQGPGGQAELVSQIRTKLQAGEPAADVWWSGDPLATLELAGSGCLQPYHSESADAQAGPGGWPKPLRGEGDLWYGVGRQLRVLMYNIERAAPPVVPTTWELLVAPDWKGQVALASPIGADGSSSRIMLAALSAVDEGKRYAQWLEDLARNQPRVLGSDAEVAAAVARGDVAMGLTDSAAAINAAVAGAPVRFRVATPSGFTTSLDLSGARPSVDPRLMQVPQTIAMVRACPHPDDAALLIDYLLCNEVAEILSTGPARLVRNGPLTSPEFTRWSDGMSREALGSASGRPPLFSVSLEGLNLATLQRHAEPIREAWIAAFKAPGAAAP